MFARQLCQHMQRTFPVIARCMRINRGGIHHFTGGIDNRHFHAGTQARIQPQRCTRAGWCCQQQIFQIAGENADRFGFGFFAQLAHQFGFQMHENFHAPCPAHGIGQPFIGRTTFLTDAEMAGDAAFARIQRRIPFRFFFFGIQTQADIQDFFTAATEQRQCAVRRNGVQGFAVIEIIGEFFTGIFFTFDDFGFDDAMFIHVFAQRCQQVGVFGEFFHQNLTCAVQCRFRIGHAGIVTVRAGEGRFQVFGGFFFRYQFRLAQQTFCQRQQTGFHCDLRLGAAFRFVRQVQVFQQGFIFCQRNRLQQFRRHFALLFNRADDGGAALFQLAQIAQALFQRTQLGVVQPAGHFFTVTRNKRHGRAFVQQPDSCRNLIRAGSEFNSKSLFDRRQHKSVFQCNEGADDTQIGATYQS